MNNATWIWEHKEDRADEHVRFFQPFFYTAGRAELTLACDSNYQLYVNGRLAGFGAYADYPHDKVYDRIDITEYCQAGQNTLSVLVWYYGADFFTYWKGLPGLIFEITAEGHTLAASGEGTLCRRAPDYRQGAQKIITTQMGFSYCYDTSLYDGSDRSDFCPEGYHNAVAVEGRPERLRVRPNQKLRLTGFAKAEPMSASRVLYDLGRETVGYLGLRFCAPRGACVRVSWGEHLILNETGEQTVPRILAERDFSVELIGCGETFAFADYMRRIGCRYFCVESDQPVSVEEIGLHEVEYPVTVLPYRPKDPLRRRIYETSLRTLRLCMFEHYEDCPWREQSLYTMDSRNQMLCGYAAFGETEFARASLQLFASDRREDGLLHICAPTRIGRPIPSFSLIWPIQLFEYTEFSADTEIATASFPKLESMLEAFYARMQDGLANNFSGEKIYWNFYEWQPTVNGRGEPWIREETVDLCLNAFLSIASARTAQLAELLRLPKRAEYYRNRAEEINRAIQARLYDAGKGLFVTTEGMQLYSELGNALAVLCGAADREQADRICKHLTDGSGGLTPATLSMKIWIYDALLHTDPEAYREFILQEIDKTYEYMLSCGATSFWETLKGAEDFHGAGSLCHGWSAIPILYYQRLLPEQA